MFENQFQENLSRINFKFQNQEILTECVKDQESFSFLKANFGPFEKGKRYKLKLFIALPFIKYGILKVHDLEKCDNTDVQRFAIEEKENVPLVKHNIPYFLNKLKEFKIIIENEVKSQKRPKFDLDLYNSYLINIIDSRLTKVLNLSKSELSLNDEQKLTNAEQFLFNEISKILKIWRSFYLKS
ncbi:MAG: hypothetical protein ACTSUL_06030 [Promethearchaeota archaeon]